MKAPCRHQFDCSAFSELYKCCLSYYFPHVESSPLSLYQPGFRDLYMTPFDQQLDRMLSNPTTYLATKDVPFQTQYSPLLRVLMRITFIAFKKCHWTVFTLTQCSSVQALPSSLPALPNSSYSCPHLSLDHLQILFYFLFPQRSVFLPWTICFYLTSLVYGLYLDDHLLNS